MARRHKSSFLSGLRASHVSGPAAGPWGAILSVFRVHGLVITLLAPCGAVLVSKMIHEFILLASCDAFAILPSHPARVAVAMADFDDLQEDPGMESADVVAKYQDAGRISNRTCRGAIFEDHQSNKAFIILDA